MGTTLGIAAMVVAGIVPTWRLHLRFRPVWRFPPGVARRAGGLALCGLAEIVVVDLASVVAIALANGHGTTGTIVIFNYATQVFNSVSAVLAISVVLSAFPVLSARDGPEFDRTSAGSTRAVLLLSWLGTAVMVAIALPAGRVLASQPDQVSALVESFVLFAPGVAGIAVIANLSRVMFVIGRLKVAAAGLAGCWLLTIVVDVVLVELVPAHLVAAALAVGNTVGQTAVAIPLVLATRRICGPAAVRDPATPRWPGWRPGPSSAALGVAVCLVAPAGGKLTSAGVAVVAVGAAVVGFGVVAYLLDRGDLKTVLARLRRWPGAGPSGRPGVLIPRSRAAARGSADQVAGHLQHDGPELVPVVHLLQEEHAGRCPRRARRWWRAPGRAAGPRRPRARRRARPAGRGPARSAPCPPPWTAPRPGSARGSGRPRCWPARCRRSGRGAHGASRRRAAGPWPSPGGASSSAK